MTYMSLATRLRPKTFETVVGQDVNVRILRNAILRGRVAPSYVFSGPAGTGKTTVARIFAAGLNCAAQVRPCGACDSCLDVADGRASHVHEIDAASDRGVATIEEVQQMAAQLLPSDAWRVFILDEAHQLSGKAWGACLKTIEEPPERNVFIFVTTDRERIIRTVQSRSSSFFFRALPTSTIYAELARVTKAPAPYGALSPAWYEVAEQDAVLQFIARASKGSLRDAFHLLDMVLLAAPVGLAEVERFVGVDSEGARDLADALLSFDFRYFVEKVDGILGRGLAPDEVARAAIEITRDFLVIEAGWTGETMSGLPVEAIKKNVLAGRGNLAAMDPDGRARATAAHKERLWRLHTEMVRGYEAGHVDRITLETAYARSIHS